jgi:FtsP/CotA-like multicopper oxidase with cupredoxin domain
MIARGTALATAGALAAAAVWLTTASRPQGAVRMYYIAADTVTWDYAPSGRNQAQDRPFNEFERNHMEPGPTRIGRVYRKALYREYRDSTFSSLAERPPEWEHLGALGPLIRAEVGDTIKVLFRNNTSFPATMHPHGVFYLKDSEGASYADGTRGGDKADDGVPPGGTHLYVWPVPERAGPGASGLSTALWMYHSHHEEVKDVNTGLLGPMIIGRRGAFDRTGRPKDVDRELVVAFAEYNETESHYARENLDKYATRPDSVRLVVGTFSTTDQEPDAEYNFKETINGFTFGHTPGLTMTAGQRVRWYVMASTNFEIHAPHWHGNVVTINHMPTDVTALLSMGMVIADMVPDNPGTWFFHCHVADHLAMGMQSLYTVAPATRAAR